MHAVDEVMLPCQDEMESAVKPYLAEGNGVVLHLAASPDGDVAPGKLQMWLRAVRSALGDKDLTAP